MRRFAVVAVLAVATMGLAPSVMAGQPLHVRAVDTVVETRPAGTECDFDYQLAYTVKSNFMIYGEPGAETRIRYQAVQVITHTNLDTGYVLTETSSIVETFDPRTGVDKLVGIAWHLRNEDGKLVTVHAGQLIIDFAADPPVVVKMTPLQAWPWADVICPALGGNPA